MKHEFEINYKSVHKEYIKNLINNLKNINDYNNQICNFFLNEILSTIKNPKLRLLINLSDYFQEYAINNLFNAKKTNEKYNKFDLVIDNFNNFDAISNITNVILLQNNKDVFNILKKYFNKMFEKIVIMIGSNVYLEFSNFLEIVDLLDKNGEFIMDLTNSRTEIINNTMDFFDVSNNLIKKPTNNNIKLFGRKFNYINSGKINELTYDDIRKLIELRLENYSVSELKILKLADCTKEKLEEIGYYDDDTCFLINNNELVYVIIKNDKEISTEITDPVIKYVFTDYPEKTDFTDKEKKLIGFRNYFNFKNPDI